MHRLRRMYDFAKTKHQSPWSAWCGAGHVRHHLCTIATLKAAQIAAVNNHKRRRSSQVGFEAVATDPRTRSRALRIGQWVPTSER